MEKFCEDIGVEPENVRKLNWSNMTSEFTLKKCLILCFNVCLYAGSDAGIGLEAWCPEYGLLHFTGVAQGNGLIAVSLVKHGLWMHLLPFYYTSCYPNLHFSSFSVIHRCDSTEKLRNSLDYLRSVLNDATSFKLIYRYAFDFARVSVYVHYDRWLMNINHHSL